MRAKVFIIAAVVALAVLSTRAQVAGAAQGARRPPAASTTPDLKTVLYRAANALGMLRGLQEEDSIARLEFWATGAMNVGGQPYKVTSYRGSLNYSVPGMRADFARTGPDGTTQRQIQVVGGKFAWNETQPGMNATPTPGAFNERLLQMWTITPEGVVKAAAAAGTNTKVTFEGGAIVLTFPAAGATMKVTLNAKNLIDRVEARAGNTVTETTYSDYGELNDSDYRADVFFPRRIVQKQGAVTVLDLTITRTNTLNPYVIMPVPENVERAAAPSQ